MPAVTLHVSGALGEALNATALGDQAPSTADPAAGVAPRLPRRPAPRVPAIKKPTLRRTGKVRPGSVRPSLRNLSMRIASRSSPSPSTPRVPDDGGGARPCGARSAGALCFPPPPRPGSSRAGKAGICHDTSCALSSSGPHVTPLWEARVQGLRGSPSVCGPCRVHVEPGGQVLRGAGGATAALATFLADCVLLSLSSVSALLAAAET